MDLSAHFKAIDNHLIICLLMFFQREILLYQQDLHIRKCKFHI